MQQTQNSKILVIKCGGSILTNPSELNNMFNDLTELKARGYQIILVHGGGPDINQLCTLLNLKSSFKNGLRVTTAEILNVTQMALLGKTNCGLVHQLNQAEIQALGLSGHDANLLLAHFIDKDSLGYVGEVDQVNHQLLNSLLSLGIMPVIAPLAVDKQGSTLNINADLAAAAVAVAMQAEKLVLLSDIDGYYANYPDKSSLIKQLNCIEVSQLLALPDRVNDGMQPKLNACLSAVSQGVSSAHIVNGVVINSLIQAVENPSQIGTTIVKGVIL